MLIELISKFVEDGFRLLQGDDINDIIEAVNYNALNSRVIMSNADTGVEEGDHTLIIRYTVPAAVIISLPTGDNAYMGRRLQIKDGGGVATSYSITIVGSIDGQGSYTFGFNYESIDVIFDGTWWNIL